jgi:O-antigen ligase
MQLALFATFSSLVVSTTHYFSGDPVVAAARWPMLGLLCAMFLLRPRQPVKLRKPRLLDAFALALLVIAGASLLYSQYPSLTIQRAVSALLLYVAVFWSVWALADFSGDDRVVDVLLVVELMTFVAGFFNLFLTDSSWLKQRYRGVLENPNAVGMLTIIFLPLSVSKWLRSRRVWALALIALIVVSVIMSGSRNGVMTATAALAFFMFRRRAWRTGLLLSALASVAYLTMPADNVTAGKATTSIQRLISGESIATGGGRIEAWQVAIPIIQQNLVLGHGFGTEERIFDGMKFKIHRGSYVHNSYLGITYQLGLVGTFLLFGPLLWLFLRRLFSHTSSNQVAAYEAVLFGGLIASIFESWVYSAGSAFALPFWICVMLLARAVILAPESAPARAAAYRRSVPPRLTLAWQPQPALLQAGRKAVHRFNPPPSGSVS